MSVRAIGRAFAEPFRSGGRTDGLLVAVYVVINALVALNAVVHDPGIGYDAFWHLEYIAHLAKGHLVSFEETHEFFSPPLAYAVPALTKGLFGLSTVVAGKLAQLLNVGCSLGTTWLVLRLGARIDQESRWLRLVALLTLGCLPVYYRSFAFVRGEPYVAFFLTAVVYLVVRMLGTGQRTIRSGVLLGLTLGLAFLSRQWAFLIVPGLLGVAGILAVRRPGERMRIAALVGTAMVVAAVTAGWFYLSLKVRYGSATAWNRGGESTFRLANNPGSFYVGTGDGELFRKPVRGSFDNQMFPIFYADMWGDYWGYFLVYGRDRRTGEKLHGGRVSVILARDSTPSWLEPTRGTPMSYLARANLLGLAPTMLLLAGVLVGSLACLRWVRGIGEPTEAPIAAITLCGLSSLLGFFVFLVLYPDAPKGGTVKATYVLQVFPLVSVLAGVALCRLRERSVTLFNLAAVALAIIFAHNLPLMVSRFVRF